MVDAQEFLNQLKKDMTAEGESREYTFFWGFIDRGSYTSDKNTEVWSDSNYRGWSYEIVEDKLEGEGGPSNQYSVLKFSKDGEDNIYVKFPAEWVSWDGMNYDYTILDARLVVPEEVVTIVYNPLT